MNSPSRPLALLGLLVLAALAGCAGKAEGANSPPVGDLAVSQGGSANVYVLDGSKSIDPDGDALTYHWNWVLGNSTTNEPKIEVEFPSALAATNANYIVSLVVRDPDGEPGFAIGNVVFGSGENKAPTPAIADTSRWVKPDTEVTLDASATKDPENNALTYEWIWGPRGTYDPKATGVANPCDEADARLATFSTGCLASGESYNLTFDKEGTFNIHCHPHPWMKGRITVAAGAPAVNQAYPIANFGFPAPLTIGVGSTLSFVNLDPDPAEHTATIEDWTPGTKSGGGTPVFKQTLAEGEYVVRLIVTDVTGSRATTTWGLKASSDAPENPEVIEHTADVPLAPSQTWSQPFNLTFSGDVSATLAWDDPSGQAFAGSLVVGRLLDDGTFDPEEKCQPQFTAGEAATVVIACKMAAGKYAYQVQAMRDGNPGFLPPGWTLEARAFQHLNPGFGDSGAGDGHGHHH